MNNHLKGRSCIYCGAWVEYEDSNCTECDYDSMTEPRATIKCWRDMNGFSSMKYNSMFDELEEMLNFNM